MAIGALTPTMLTALRRERRRMRFLFLGLGLGLELGIALLLLYVWLSSPQTWADNLSELAMVAVVIAIIMALCAAAQELQSRDRLHRGSYVRYEGPFEITLGPMNGVRWGHLAAGEHVAKLGGAQCWQEERRRGGFLLGGDFIFAADDETGVPLYRHSTYRIGPGSHLPGPGLRARLERLVDGD